jgi:hypothetical protein
MKRIVIAVGLIVLLSAVSAAAQAPAPKPGPEHKRLDYFLGKWTYEITDGAAAGSGTITWEPFTGGLFVCARETYKLASGSAGEIRHVFGYSAEDKTYTWYRYWSNGWSEMARGWLKGNVWTYAFDVWNPMRQSRRQFTLTETPPDGMTFIWEESVDGAPWRVTARGKATRVK